MLSLQFLWTVDKESQKRLILPLISELNTPASPCSILESRTSYLHRPRLHVSINSLLPVYQVILAALSDVCLSHMRTSSGLNYQRWTQVPLKFHIGTPTRYMPPRKHWLLFQSYLQDFFEVNIRSRLLCIAEALATHAFKPDLCCQKRFVVSLSSQLLLLLLLSLFIYLFIYLFTYLFIFKPDIVFTLLIYLYRTRIQILISIITICTELN